MWGGGNFEVSLKTIQANEVLILNYNTRDITAIKFQGNSVLLPIMPQYFFKYELGLKSEKLCKIYSEGCHNRKTSLYHRCFVIIKNEVFVSAFVFKENAILVSTFQYLVSYPVRQSSLKLLIKILAALSRYYIFICSTLCLNITSFKIRHFCHFVNDICTLEIYNESRNIFDMSVLFDVCCYKLIGAPV